jgi:hypothetical protein
LDLFTLWEQGQSMRTIFVKPESPTGWSVSYLTGQPEFAPDRFAARREIDRLNGAEIIMFKNLLGDQFIALRLQGSAWIRSNTIAQRMERGVREPYHKVVWPHRTLEFAGVQDWTLDEIDKAMRDSEATRDAYGDPVPSSN